MARFRGDHSAFGKPGIDPKWTHGGKDGAGTAYATSSRIWFTVWNGILTETYYPTIDRPQIRDLQYLITDGRTFFHEEKRHLRTAVENPLPNVLAYRCTNQDPNGRYQIEKQIITDPHLSCVLQHTKLTGDPRFLSELRIYALCSPHLEVGGWGNNAYIVEAAGRHLLTAERRGTWLAIGASVPFSRCSCGYVGRSDGWTDLADNFEMDWEFDQAVDGNVALTGEIHRDRATEFTLGLAIGNSLQNAVTTLLQAIGMPFQQQFERYVDQWSRPARKSFALEEVSGNGGNLYKTSIALLLAHEDKNFPGAFIASLSIPWGEAKGDEDTGGYHLVWTRDMVQSATALLACGHTETPLRALIYLAASQQEDGGFPQNFWLDGEPYWRGIQLDEVAFPVILAWRILQTGALCNFDPFPMVRGCANYLILHGPATEQERWEEQSGYSPSTLASNIAALLCAASFFRERNEENTACFIEEYADFLESQLERWTVTDAGSLVPGITRHYIRVNPIDVNDPCPREELNSKTIILANRRPGTQYEFLAKDIIDAGFLELVRYGIRRPDDPIIVDSLKVVDALLKVETPFGPCWRRYNHDGYGQREDGGAYDGWGCGRAWPLLTGERGHYELAAGRDAIPYLRAIERFASRTGLLTEQVWDAPDLPDKHLFLGRPTGAAMPLMWAHSEYIKLLRSVKDKRVFDLIPLVSDRYTAARKKGRSMEVWKHNRQACVISKGGLLRVIGPANFLLHWTNDDWRTRQDSYSRPTALGIEYVDIEIPSHQSVPVRFTFFWPGTGRWEGRDYEVRME